MRHVEVDGLRSSVIGLGTWQFGSREWGYGEAYATEIAPALVRRALELGITMLDTAEVYGLGRSERIVGAALAAVPPAEGDGLVTATKFLPIAPTEAILARQAAGSRRRLGVDALDLYYAHWPNPSSRCGGRCRRCDRWLPRASSGASGSATTTWVAGRTPSVPSGRR